MAKGQGNPNHAPAGAPGGTGGQFVSGPETGAEQGQEQVAKKETKTKAKKAPFKKRAPKVDESKLDSMFAKLMDLNQSISVGPLEKAEDIEQNIDKLFNKRAIEHIDRLFGKANSYCPYIFHPKSNEWVDLNLFTCILGKYRYPDNHAHFIPNDQFEKMAADKEHYTLCYRGFSSEGEKRKSILKGYGTADIDNLDIYGNGVYGTNIYTSTSFDYSKRGYAGNDANKVLHCLVDRTARKVKTEDLRREFESKLHSSYNYSTGKTEEKPLMTSLIKKFESHLINNGIEAGRANKMADGFKRALENDISLFAILLGYDYQISSGGSQRNILNLSKWYIKADKTGVR